MTLALDAMMDFDLTPEQRLVRRAVRDFAEKEILPHVEAHEREARYPIELIRTRMRDIVEQRNPTLAPAAG